MLITLDDLLETVWQKAWKELKGATVDRLHPMRYLVLATQGENFPGQRTVVLRMVDEKRQLWVFTDCRSSKIAEISHNPRVSVLTYHPAHKVQFRMVAMAQIHHQDSVSRTFWERIQGPPRKAYGSRLAPGTLLALPQDAHQWPESIDGQFFSAVCLQPLELEVLQLDGLEHLRARFTLQGSVWQETWVVP